MTAPPSAALSIALCTCDGEDRFLGAQLASIAAQTHPPDELVVCDDASRDATCAIVRRFATEVPFPVRLHRQAARLGASRNFAAAIAHCAGDVIVLSDQDDVWSPHKLERIAGAFAAGATPGLVFSDADIVDATMRPTGRTVYEAQGMDARVRAQLATDALPHLIELRGGPLGLTQAFCASLRPLILPLPPYREHVMAHDVWIDLVAGSVAAMIGLDERLVSYRQHGGQLVGAPRRPPAPPSPIALRAQLTRRPDRGVPRAVAHELLLRLDGWAPPPGPQFEDWSRRAQRSRAFLTDRLRHLRARDELPPAFARRSITVAAELCRGRYHRHSRGLPSAAKDLLTAPGQSS